MESGYIYVSGQSCDTCPSRYDCKFSDILISSDNPDNPCEGCNGRKRKKKIIKDGYDIGPHWYPR